MSPTTDSPFAVEALCAINIVGVGVGVGVRNIRELTVLFLSVFFAQNTEHRKQNTSSSLLPSRSLPACEAAMTELSD
jgi:hypothetical protein